MSISKESFEYLVRLSDEGLDLGDVSKLLSMLENDEEVLAHLALKLNVFSSCPEIHHAILDVARENVILPHPMRAGQSDLLEADTLEQTCAEALYQVIKDEQSKASNVTQYLAARSKVSERTPGEFGSHYLTRRVKLPGHEV
jgi:hypothetical protein